MSAPPAFERPVKRSISIAGHRTSVTLEAPYWEQLKARAAGQARPLAKIVAEVDALRGEVNLSSALRQYLLRTPPQ